nr:transposase [uncultured Lactobacillus sp.]
MDLRQHNTQERIVAGLIDCLEAKPFRELENKDIYNKAGITYRTFFRYYSDKNELLNNLEKNLINGLQSALIKDRNSLICLKHEPDLLTFYNYPPAIRASIYSTNMIESFNNRLKRKTKPKTKFPTEQSLDTFIGVQAMDYNDRYFNRIHKGFEQVRDILESYFD